MSERELVFVLDAEHVLNAFKGETKVIDPWNPEFKDLFEKFNKGYFVDREEAEKNPAWKQIIPYCCFVSQGIFAQPEHFFTYERGKKGSEARLHAKKSIGIGGHINPVDADKSVSGKELVYTAAMREILEETGYEVKDHFEEPSFLIYDPSNEVGKVHIGVVYMIRLAKDDLDKLTSAELPVVNPQVLSYNNLVSNLDSLETWSQLIVQAM